MNTFLLIVTLCCLCFAWGVVGLLYFLYKDLFGKRYDYDKPYKFSVKEWIFGGPIVWFLEIGAKITSKRK